MERVDREKRYKIVNTPFLIEARDCELVNEHVVESADEMGKVLEEDFKISPPAPLDELFAKIAS